MGDLCQERAPFHFGKIPYLSEFGRILSYLDYP